MGDIYSRIILTVPISPECLICLEANILANDAAEATTIANSLISEEQLQQVRDVFSKAKGDALVPPGWKAVPITEELRARNATLVEELNRLASEEFDDSDAPYYNEDSIPIVNWLMEQFRSRVSEIASATQQDADAFIVEERAKALEEFMSVWFDKFMQRVCELPDRNSPEDEPDAVVATLEELRNCMVGTIEDACDELRASAAHNGSHPKSKGKPT